MTNSLTMCNLGGVDSRVAQMQGLLNMHGSFLDCNDAARHKLINIGCIDTVARQRAVHAGRDTLTYHIVGSLAAGTLAFLPRVLDFAHVMLLRKMKNTTRSRFMSVVSSFAIAVARSVLVATDSQLMDFDVRRGLLDEVCTH